MRPVMEVGRDYVVLQYHTRTPTETRVQIRQSDLPMTAWRPEGQRTDLWQGAGVRIVQANQASAPIIACGSAGCSQASATTTASTTLT
jgi:hypothetical protein